MFGFPTRVRTLYYPEGHGRVLEVSDRPLGQAVSMFSPGSLVIRDGWVYEANGFASYNSRTGRSDNPLAATVDGPALHLVHATPSPTCRVPRTSTCPVCRARCASTTMHQPLGFRTSENRSDRRVGRVRVEQRLSSCPGLGGGAGRSPSVLGPWTPGS